MEMVSFLVQHDASVNQADSEGWTPLHVAASCGYPEIAEWVISCLRSVKTHLGKSEIILQQTEVFFFTRPVVDSMIGLALHVKTWSTSNLLNLLFLGNFSFTLKRSLVDWIVDFV